MCATYFSNKHSGSALLTEIERELGEHMPCFRQCISGYIFETPTEASRHRFLPLDGATFEGFPLYFAVCHYEMSGDDIFDFVTTRLKEEAEVQDTLQAYGCMPAASMVQIESPSEASNTTVAVFRKCWTCHRGGRPFAHDHRRCESAQKAIAKRSARHNPGEGTPQPNSELGDMLPPCGCTSRMSKKMQFWVFVW